MNAPVFCFSVVVCDVTGRVKVKTSMIDDVMCWNE
jgi:hypothetical protein